MRWLDSVTNSMDMRLSKLQEMVKDRGARHVVVHRVVGSWTQLSDWTTGGKGYWRERLGPVLGKKGKWKREAAVFPPVFSLPGERHPCSINADPHPWGLRAGISASGGTPAINSLWTHNNWVSPWEGKCPLAGGHDMAVLHCSDHWAPKRQRTQEEERSLGSTSWWASRAGGEQSWNLESGREKGFPGSSVGRESACMQETSVWVLGREDLMGKG